MGDCSLSVARKDAADSMAAASDVQTVIPASSKDSESSGSRGHEGAPWQEAGDEADVAAQELSRLWAGVDPEKAWWHEKQTNERKLQTCILEIEGPSHVEGAAAVQFFTLADNDPDEVEDY